MIVLVPLLASLPSLLPASPPPVPAPASPVLVRQQGADFPALELEWKREQAAYKKALENAKAAGKKRAEWPADPAQAFYPRFEALAKGGEGRAALWMCEHLRDAWALSARRRAAGALLDLLIEAGDEAWVAQALPQIVRTRGDFDAARLKGHLEALGAEGRPDASRVAAKTALGDMVEAEKPLEGMELLLEACRLAGSIEKKPGATAMEHLLAAATRSLNSGEPERVERAMALLSEVVRRWPESDAAEEADQRLFQLQYLSVGRLAPDFETHDAEGNFFRLSDYRGKVTLIDFWGFW